MKKYSLYIAIVMMTSACAPQGLEALNSVASQTVDDIACKNKSLESKLWDGLKGYLIEQKQIPTADVMQEAFEKELERLSKDNPGLSKAQISQLSKELKDLIQSLLSEAPQGERIETAEQLLLLLSAIDVGDRTTVFRSYMQDKVRGQFNQLSKTIQTLDTSCSQADSDVVETPRTEPDANRDYEYHKNQALAHGTPLSVFGTRWAFATTYQNCRALETPDLDSRVPNIEGISIVGTHPDGVGSKRMIASLSSVQNTHPYLKGITSYAQGCFSVRDNPLIYDYGGKPYATTAADSPIDLFKNNGDGTSVLGIDCSGYVFTAMAAAGLRLKAGRALKASDSWAWGSSTYVEPQSNGLTCLSKITVTPSASLKAGDIVAVYGHVLMIDKAGSDPFGIKSVQSISDCSKLTSNFFDFTVSQSSPNVNGVGINNFEAKSYLPTSAKMKAGLEKYAYYACLAKFNNQSYTPNVGTLSVVRHKGTADCMAPRVVLSRESCVQSCQSFERN